MSERLRLIERIFHGSLQLAEEERRAYLVECCGGDAALLADVESLIRYAGQHTDDLRGHVAPTADDLLRQHVSASVFEPNAMLGPYRIERVLGQGGMGIAYLAFDTRLGRRVAIKTVGGVSAFLPKAADDLLREARAAATLVHPNIAALYDCGSTEGTPWFVMEYVPGVTLRTLLSQGSVPEEEVLRHAAQLVSALEYAHAKHLIHRDIKPENILIADDGGVKVIDFGLASMTQWLDAASPMPLRGTLSYIAPELLDGRTPTPASDIYSVGVVLYEMATGLRPSRSGADEQLLSLVATERNGVVEARLPGPGLSRVIAKCLATDPGERYRDGAELSAALAALGPRRVSVAGERPRPRLLILDFVNSSGTDGWLGTAIADSVAADLSRFESVSVATRRRVLEATYQPGADGLLDADAALALARHAAAQWIVSGTYQQLGHRVRVTPRVTDVSTGAVRPTSKVDGELESVFDLQDRVAGAVLDALHIEAVHRVAPAAHQLGTPRVLASEHYARGRQRLYRMEAAALREAIVHFEHAIVIDPAFAPAYAGLGTGYALLFLRTSNPDDVARASGYLERATELDPAFGEPYPWLVNSRFRQNNPAGALDAANKGVALQPDLPEAHYFSGGVHYMMAEYPGCNVNSAPGLLAECLRLQPYFHPAWIVLGATAMFLGQHTAAAGILSTAIALEHEPALAFRFVGAQTLLGLALVRSGDWAAASAALQEGLEVLEDREHVYRETFRALSCCGLGDVALRTGAPDTALSHYRRASRIARDAARSAGSARLMFRADAGLAAAYAAVGQHERGRQLADQAAATLEEVAAHTGTITFECGLGQLCLDLAVAEVRLGALDRAATLLARAVTSGWRDAVWLSVDPELHRLHDHPVASAAMAVLQRAAFPPIEVPATSPATSLR
jgi:serine/threonine protein kinase/tetratricopeptide (TPR) repeat protein